LAEEGETFTARLIAEEVTALNGDFALPEVIEVITASCGEANAFYDPAERRIVMCEEFEGHLRELYGLLSN
jgi:hypothetical protein